MNVIQEIAAERERQQKQEGYSTAHDDEHAEGELAQAAACYAIGRRIPIGLNRTLWPWSEADFKPKNRRADLIRAGALIVAEIERLDRGEAA